MKILHYLCVGGHKEKLIGNNKQHQQLTRPSVKMAYKQVFLKFLTSFASLYLPFYKALTGSFTLDQFPSYCYQFVYLFIYIFIFLSFSAVTCLFIWVFEWLLKRSVNSSAIPEDKGLLGRSEATLPRGLTGNQKEKRAAKVFEPTCTRIFILAINWLTSSTLVQMTSVSMQVQFPLC